MLPFLVE